MPKQYTDFSLDDFMAYILSDSYVTTEFIEQHYNEDMIKEIMQEHFTNKDKSLITALREFHCEYHTEFQEYLREQGHNFNEDREDEDR